VAGFLLGFTEPQDFAEMITERVGVDEDVGKAIATDIDAQLFDKIRDSLKKMTAGAAEETTPGSSVSPAARAMPATPPQPPPKAPPTPQNLPATPGGDMHPAERALVEPTSGIAKTVNVGLPPAGAVGASSSAPELKKYDPYREPVE